LEGVPFRGPPMEHGFPVQLGEEVRREGGALLGCDRRRRVVGAPWRCAASEARHG
jgi:hypothetical protein